MRLQHGGWQSPPRTRTSEGVKSEEDTRYLRDESASRFEIRNIDTYYYSVGSRTDELAPIIVAAVGDLLPLRLWWFCDASAAVTTVLTNQERRKNWLREDE